MPAPDPVRSSVARVWKDLLFLLFLGLVFLFSTMHRTDFAVMTAIYYALFALYILILHPRWNNSKYHFRWVLFTAVSARLLLLTGEPNLSDDYFRFIWDGRLLLNGMNPFDFKPDMLMASYWQPFEGADALYANMNSGQYYSLYPPVNQFLFYLANLVSPQFIFPGMFFLKLVFLGAEAVTLFALYGICKALRLPVNIVGWYALNPLVIIELAGNLHFEAIMIAFLVSMFYLLINGRWILAAAAFSGAVLTKVHPLMLLPFIAVFLGWKRGAWFSGISLLIIIGAFLPLLLPPYAAAWRIENMMTSFRLYYASFEFNAGIYYILRWIGTQVTGYNPIAIVGRLLMILQLIVLAVLLFRMKRTPHGLIHASFLAYLSYVLLSTTVHPWYILPLLPLALMLGYRSITAWTALVFLSYFAYAQPGWQENFGLLTLEYTCIFACLLYEFYHRNKLHEST